MKNAIYDFLACILILLTHFTNYLVYSNYTKIFPDIIFVAAIICAAAVFLTVALRLPSTIVRTGIFALLITVVLGDILFEFGTNDDITFRLVAMSATLLAVLALVFFLREHTNKVLFGTFLAVLFSTVVLAQFSLPKTQLPTAATPIEGKKRLPIVVHLILDEHTGLAAITSEWPDAAATGNYLQDFYVAGGFRLFGRAYSQYFRTEASLASSLNFDPDGQPRRHLTKRRYGFALNRNAYLKNFAEQGFRINIYQSNYLDMCGGADIEIRKCVTYRPDVLDEHEIAELPATQRSRLIFNMYYSSIAVVKVLKLAAKSVDAWLNGFDLGLPRLGLWHGRVGPIAIGPTLSRITQDISRSAGGELFFAHLLMPHYPYVYDQACAVRSPVSSWGERQDANGTNTPDTRRQRYAQYFDQVRCATRKLDGLFDAMKANGTYANATIVIHGDHGSRIGLTDPSVAAAPTMTTESYMDSFSTLFAIKAPGIPSGTDPRMLSLPQLLGYAATLDDGKIPVPSNPTVYIADDRLNYIAFPLPDFPDVWK